MKNEFIKSNYVTRDLDEVMQLNSSDFEIWVNEYHKATKPLPDKGVDESARKRKFEIETSENIEVELITPEQMLDINVLQ